MAGSAKEELMIFVADLKQKMPTITWDEIAGRVEKQFPQARGLPFTSNAIRKRYHVWLKKSEESRLSNNKDQGEKIAMSPNEEKQLPQGLVEYIENYIEEYMRPVIERVSVEAAQKVFAQKFSLLQDISVATRAGHPPAPPMPDTVEGTRRHTVPRGKLAGTVDAALLELFESERKERGFSVSRMLDVVLWTYFGIGRAKPPKLSFELSESSRFTENE